MHGRLAAKPIVGDLGQVAIRIPHRDQAVCSIVAVGGRGIESPVWVGTGVLANQDHAPEAVRLPGDLVAIGIDGLGGQAIV